MVFMPELVRVIEGYSESPQVEVGFRDDVGLVVRVIDGVLDPGSESVSETKGLHEILKGEYDWHVR